MKYETPLKERERLSRLKRRKYWSDPDFRLQTINRARIWQGREPYSSAEEIPVLGRRVA